MKNLQVTLIFLFLASCSSSVQNNYGSNTVSPNPVCCAYQASNGICYKELVPGCASDAAPLFKQQFLAPERCCKSWTADGICQEEYIEGCSGPYSRSFSR